MKNLKIFKFLKIIWLAFGNYKRQISVLIILGFLGGLFEGIGVNALIPLFSFITEGDNTGADMVSRLILKLFSFLGIPFSFVYLLIFISFLFLLKMVVSIVFNYIKVKIRTDYEKRMRGELFEGTLKAEWPYLLKQKLGHLETLLMINVQNSTSMLESIARTIMVLTSLLMYLLIAINISFSITVLTLLAGGLIFLSMKTFIGRIRHLSRKTEKLNKEVSRHVNETILGMKTIKATLSENKIIKKSNDYFDSLKNFQIRSFLLQSLPLSFIQPFSIVFICLIFGFSYYYNQSFNLASLAAIIYLIQRIFTYLQSMQSSLNDFSSLTPFLEKVLDYKNEIRRYKEQDDGRNSFHFQKILEFNGLQFSYNNETSVLSDINFKVRRGEMLGLIGLSGAGKTTMFDLILRLFKPTGGKILIDGKNINEIDLREWRKNIEYMSQDLFLMNDTILNNIKFYDENISFDEVVQASKRAYIYDFIQTLPDKFETLTGERGIKLSVGQRQRIAIARSLVRKPQILLLDEATSALDSESEIQIQKAIEELSGNVTILVIAHRLSTVMGCDKLLVLDGGKIIEQGNPQELLKDKDSYFYKVYNIRK